jgi:hypothetical protein
LVVHAIAASPLEVIATAGSPASLASVAGAPNGLVTAADAVGPAGATAKVHRTEMMRIPPVLKRRHVTRVTGGWQGRPGAFDHMIRSEKPGRPAGVD